MGGRNDLDDYVSDRDQRSAGFAELVKAAERRREFARQLAEHRKKRGLSQTVVAARMGTSPSMVIRVEAGADVKLSTMEKYLAAVGSALRMQMGGARKRGAGKRSA